MELYEVILVLGVIALAHWTKDFIYFFVAGIVTILISTQWAGDYPGVMVIFWAIATYLLAQAVIKILAETGPARGWSQFRGLWNKVRGRRA